MTLPPLLAAASARLSYVLAADPTPAPGTGGLTDPGPKPPPNTAGISTLLSYLEWGGTVVAVVGILMVAYKLMLSGDQHRGGELGNLGKVGFGMVLAGSAFGIAGAVL